MTPNAVCTIITPDYVAYALALFESLNANIEKKVDMYVFISTPKINSSEGLPTVDGLYYVFIDELCRDGMGKKLFDKYLEVNIHAFRWSMKSVLLQYLLTRKSYKKAIFLDGDLFFYSDFQFLYDKLDSSRLLLTPHWRSSDPFADPSNFQEMFNRGIYNAGFVAVNKEAIPILEWWSKVCEFKCEFLPEQGYHADQTYLNLFPVYFDGVEILKHKGCNVAAWNRLECRRALASDGSVLIANEFPVVFIHFTKSTIKGIMNGKDELLQFHLKEYSRVLKKYSGPNIMDQSNLGDRQKKSKPFSVRFKSFVKKNLKKWVR